MTKVEIEACLDINDVRRNIDEIDEAIVSLVAKRGAYVKQASKFKTTKAEVEAPKRVEQVLLKVAQVAECKGANVKVVQSIWQAMICAFIEVEKEELAKKFSDS
jgi:isochorismate pyruvate lyase